MRPLSLAASLLLNDCHDQQQHTCLRALPRSRILICACERHALIGRTRRPGGYGRVRGFSRGFACFLRLKHVVPCWRMHLWLSNSVQTPSEQAYSAAHPNPRSNRLLASILQHHNPSYAPIASRRAALPGESRACSTIHEDIRVRRPSVPEIRCFPIRRPRDAARQRQRETICSKSHRSVAARGQASNNWQQRAPSQRRRSRHFSSDGGVANLATALEYAKLNDDVSLVSIFTSGHVAREELRKPSCCYGDRPLALGASREVLGRLHPPGDQLRPVESLEEATCLILHSSVPTTEDCRARATRG